MPPKKRTSTEANTGSNKPTANKKQRTSNNQQPEKGQDRRPAASGQQDVDQGREQFTYYCIPVPYSEFEVRYLEDAKNSDGDEEEEEPEDAAEEAYRKQFDSGFLLKPAAELPDHKWIATWEAWKHVTVWKHGKTFVDPDNFGMHASNDFAGYGMQEMIENMLLAFDGHFKKKDRSEETIKLMWSTAAAVGHWLLIVDTEQWLWSDDGERIGATVAAIGNMILTALNELDRADLLKVDSPIQDLGLVMAIFVAWGREMEVFAFEGEESSWYYTLGDYAAKANIDLRQLPIRYLGKVFAHLSEKGKEPAALEGPAKADRWGWKKSLKKIGTELGGHHYDITKMSRKQRSAHTSDGLDPLAGIPDKDIKKGNIARI